MNKSYLALGDSYTIGEAVPALESFPFQLVEKLRQDGQQINDPQIIATTGWTTDELIKAVDQANIQGSYDLVTLLIGVNNQYRGYSQEVYRQEFKELLVTALRCAGGEKNRVFVLSIPDWGVTDFAKKSDRDLETISREIDEFNAINLEEAVTAGVEYVDITPGSREAATDATLIASDGLHPSGKMYGEWVELLLAKMKG